MILGIIVGFLSALTGWRINLVAINRGLEQGKKSAFFIGIGATVGDLLFLSIVFLGIGPLVRHPEFWNIAKWIGVVSILAVGLDIFFRKPKISALNRKRIEPAVTATNFMTGLILVITNPAILLLWMGITGFLFTYFHEMHHMFFRIRFQIGFFSGATIWFIVLSLFILPKIKQLGERYIVIISKITGILLFLAALLLIFDKS